MTRLSLSVDRATALGDAADIAIADRPGGRDLRHDDRVHQLGQRQSLTSLQPLAEVGPGATPRPRWGHRHRPECLPSRRPPPDTAARPVPPLHPPDRLVLLLSPRPRRLRPRKISAESEARAVRLRLGGTATRRSPVVSTSPWGPPNGNETVPGPGHRGDGPGCPDTRSRAAGRSVGRGFRHAETSSRDRSRAVESDCRASSVAIRWIAASASVDRRSPASAAAC